MPNILVIPNSDRIDKEQLKRIYPELSALAISVLNTQGGLRVEHVRIIPVQAWEGQIHQQSLSLIIQVKRTPDYLAGLSAFPQTLAQTIKSRLLELGIFNETDTLKVNLMLIDSATASA
ncbi:MAG: hypothetical protein HYT12_00890 [Candidatus Liptonbacteria bacterium]|nr:hypothetical protein [Candidatus Liptonbacteria bacterium]